MEQMPSDWKVWKLPGKLMYHQTIKKRNVEFTLIQKMHYLSIILISVIQKQLYNQINQLLSQNQSQNQSSKFCLYTIQQKMNSVLIKQRKLSFLRKPLNNLIKKDTRLKHNKTSSMDIVFLLPGRNDKVSQNKVTNCQRQMERIDEMIQGQFLSLKWKFQNYCRDFNQKNVHVQDNEENRVTKDNKQMYTTQNQIFELFRTKISTYLNQKNKYPSQSLKYRKDLNTGRQTDRKKNQTQSRKFETINNTDSLDVQKSQNILQKFTGKIINKSIGSNQFDLKIDMDCSMNKSKTNLNNRINTINSMSTLSDLLYKQEKQNKIEDLHQFFQGNRMMQKPVISQIYGQNRSKVEDTRNYLKLIYEKVKSINLKLSNSKNNRLNMTNNFSKVMNKSIAEEIHEIYFCLQKIDQIHHVNSLIFKCPRPCCEFQKQRIINASKAKMLMALTNREKKQIHYKTELTENYFTYFYKNDNFDKSRIFSLSRTNAQKMQNLEKTYKKNQQNLKKCNKRCNSLSIKTQ